MCTTAESPLSKLAHAGTEFQVTKCHVTGEEKL